MRDKMLNPALLKNPVLMAHSCRMRAKTINAIAGGLRDSHAVDVLRRQAAKWEEIAAEAERRAAQNSSRNDRPPSNSDGAAL